MKKTRNLARQTAAFAAAMMIVLSGAGVMTGTGMTANQTVMTAVAAESTTLTPQTFGMKTPADKVLIYHGSVLTKEATWDELSAGINISGANNYVVLEYPDGSLKYDVSTKRLIENTRTEGVSREEFYVSYDTIKEYASGSANSSIVAAFSTQRNPVNGLVGTPLEMTDGTAVQNGSNYLLYEMTEENNLAVFDYTEGTDIYLFLLNVRSGGTLVRYDYETNELTGTVVSQASNSPVHSAKFNYKAFSVPDDYTSVKVATLGKGIVTNANESYGYSEDVKSVLYTPAEWRSNQCAVNYSAGNFDTYDTINELLQITFFYENGSSVNYSYICDTPYMNRWQYVNEFLMNAAGETVKDNNDNIAIEAFDENGNPIVTNEVLGLEPQEGDYTVTVYKGAEPIETMTGKVFENGKYVIEDYSPDDNYYVKVGYADGSDDYKMFRYNDGIGGAWEQRVDTKETPEITLPIDMASFPEEYAGGYATENGNSIVDWSAEEFAAGAKELTIPTKDSDDYDFVFTYPKGSDDYVLVGIDPELKASSGTKNYTPVPVDTNAEAGDKIHVTGETEDGNPVDFEYIVEKGKEDEPLLLPDGEYVVVDETKGIKDEVIADGDGSEGKAGSVDANGNVTDENGKTSKEKLNLINPEMENHFVITAPDGTVIDEGSVEDGTFDNIADVNVDKDTITGQSYVEYDVVIGQTNSTDPEKVSTESGIIYDIDIDGDFVKADSAKLKIGDVNLDGKVSLKDAVMLQKYLHNKQSFKFENFYNADMNNDGKANVFDLVLLKRELLKK